MVDDIRHRQEHIEFMESYIDELTEKIDALTEGRDFDKLIRSLEYRLDVLGKSEDKNELFKGRIDQITQELDALKKEYARLKPILDELEVERAYYRAHQATL